MGKAYKPKDPNGRYVKIYVSLLQSPAWRVLGSSAKALYLDIRETLYGTNNGNIDATLTNLKHKGYRHGGTIANALYELRALGFVEQTRGGGVEFGSRVCSLYRFTDLPVFEQPKLAIAACKETHDYLQFKTLQEARKALKEGKENFRAAALERKKKMVERKKITLRELYPTDTNVVSIGDVDRSNKRSRSTSTSTNSESGKISQKMSKTRMETELPTDFKEAVQ